MPWLRHLTVHGDGRALAINIELSPAPDVNCKRANNHLLTKFGAVCLPKIVLVENGKRGES